jgi:hypothetical protein
MQSENFDNKIREAADHHHPNYDEQAWAKMENLLEKHMPVKEKKKRRILFFFLLFLFTTGGAWLIIEKPWNGANTVAKMESNTSRDLIPTENGINVNSKEKQVISNSNESEVNFQTPAQVNPFENIDEINKPAGKHNPANEQFSKGTRNVDGKNESLFSVGVTKANTGTITKGTVEVQSNSVRNNELAVTGTSRDIVESEENKVTPVKEEQNTVNIIDSNVDSVTQKESVNKNDEESGIKESKTNASVTEKVKKKNSFFLSGSLAPDVSMVGGGKVGPVKLLGGFGVGFTFKEKITLRTGFYSGRKLYTAAPEDYKPDAAIPSPEYLNRVEADCKVFEIPIFLSYNFKSTKGANLFATTGLSTYIMKKESYDYVYKYPGSDDEHIYNWSVTDENTHTFSVLTFSLGYERMLGKKLSVSAEPYFKLPLSGVGIGRVKLNSSGVLFSVKYKLFGN